MISSMAALCGGHVGGQPASIAGRARLGRPQVVMGLGATLQDPTRPRQGGPKKLVAESGRGSRHSMWLSMRQKRGSLGRLIVRANAGTGRLETLPIFPLSIVALPSADVPLQIFEARYRVLFTTLLAGSEGLEDGLINPEKPWCGTRRFGMSFFDPKNSGLAAIGTVLEIKEHARLEDGRLVVQNIGRERFRIKKVVEERPVLVCEVEYLPEEDEQSEEVRALAAEVAQLFRSVVSLAVKLRDTTLSQELNDPSQLTELSPSQMSFWVASLFSGNPYQQQALLEMDSTLARLQAEEELLSGTLKYLSAQSALQGAFKSSGSANIDEPTGGPD